MPKKSENEQIKQKLNELERKVDKLSQTTYGYIYAMLHILSERGVTDQGEFRKFLKAYKKRYSQIARDIEFLKIVRQLKRKSKS